jgi:2-dehydropantoate 2-reductase
MEATTSSILIVGAGAVGAFYGAALARSGARVSVVCRSDFAAVAQDGFHIRSEALGDQRFVPARVFAATSEVDEIPDVVVLTVKVLPSLDRVALLRPVTRPSTTLVLIQNGIDIEAEIQAAFPDNELLSALAFIGVSRTGPGQIHHQALGSLSLGRYPGGASPAADALATAFGKAGVTCTVTADVITARWQKAVWNAAFNPISIMGGVIDTAIMLGTAEGERLVRRAMQEVCAVAAAVGRPLPPGLADQYIAGTRAIPAYKTSMALDLEHGRALEVEAILGNTVRAGLEASVPIPTLETLYALARMIEQARSSHAALERPRGARR